MAAAQPRDVGVPLITIGAGLGIGGLMFGLPGMVLLWLALLLAGIQHPQPQFRASERDLPETAAAQAKHKFYRTLAASLVFPTRGWLPGWPPLYAFFAALLAGVAMWHWPQGHVAMVAEPIDEASEATLWPLFSLLNGLSTVVIIWALVWARRCTLDLSDICPGTRVSDAVKKAKRAPHAIIAPGALGAVLGLFLAPAAYPYTNVPGILVSLLALVTGAMLGTYPAARQQALGKWRQVLNARRDWDERFRSMKKDPAPRLTDIEELGDPENPVIVHDLSCTSARENAESFFLKEDQMVAALGGAADAAIAPVNRLDSQGNPMPGTVDLMRFSVIELPAPDQVPSIADSSTSDEIVEAQLRALFAWITTALMQRCMMTDWTVITTGERRVIAVDFTGDASAVKSQAPATAERLGVDAVVDQRANGRKGQLYIGDFENAEYADDSPVDATAIQQFADEDMWNERFSEMLRKDTAAPTPQWRVASQEELPGGVVIHELPFVMRKGFTVEDDFFPHESKLATAMDQAHFVSLSGYQQPGGAPGERYKQAFVVRWSDQPVPTDPKRLPPNRSAACRWVLQHIVNQAFFHAKLPRPELVSATPLTIPRSMQHLWSADFKLHGGITLAEVRKKERHLRSAIGTEFLQIDKHEAGLTIIFGADPDNPTTLLQTKARKRLDALKWERVFADSGITPESGLLPRLLDSQPVADNDKINVLTFSLRGTGLALEAFTARRPKLSANSGMGFVLPQPAASGKPDQIELVVSEQDPMPFPALPDYAAIDSSEALPFAVDIYGRVIEYDPSETPHALIAGTSGGGKSVLLQFLMYGALIRGWEVYIADPSKGGADFYFTEDHIAGMTGDVYEAAGMMRHVYAEVTRRKGLITQYKVSKLSELPGDVRPPRAIIFLDEFTSLMMQEKPPEKTDDPEASAEREEIVRINAEKQTIGFLAGKIAREARSAEVTLVLATQKLTAKTLDAIPGSSDLRSNLGRGLLGSATLGDRQSALRNPYDAPDLGDSIPPGRGLWEPVTSPISQAIQSWYDPRGQGGLREELNRRVSPWPEEERPDWRAQVRQYDDSPAVQVIDDTDDVEPMTQELGELEIDDWDFAD
ncbi:FtsK/SpoIIIE domain-containing protein [Nesterenkonia rhizosphaerae]|uniref:FtsK domain-containing protein n=1 Tax=Nesterenkonia rhizosphaerae TaxID=1348272 RepID=A0ABP9G0N7_9MICC